MNIGLVEKAGQGGTVDVENAGWDCWIE